MPTTPHSTHSLLLVAMTTAQLFACSGAQSGGDGTGGPSAGTGEDPNSVCPAQAQAPQRLPHVDSAHLTAGYWIGRASQYGDIDAALLTPTDIRSHARALRSADDGRPLGQVDLRAPVDSESLGRELIERFAFLHERFENGTYVEADGTPVDAAFVSERAAAQLPEVRAELRIALAPVALRCAPRSAGYYTVSRDLDFDRNSCSTTRAQEPLLIVARYPGGMRLARTRYAIGFIDDDADLSPVLGE